MSFLHNLTQLMVSRAYSDANAVGDRIPNAVENVVSAGIVLDRDSGLAGGARLRLIASVFNVLDRRDRDVTC